MITISLCMIVKNEEDTLARCLDTIKDIVDEIIIIDTGSKDKTKDIAGRYTTKIYDFQWINDFAAARNYSFSKATKEYIMWLDADDVLLEKDREKLIQLKKVMNPEIDIVMMKYNIKVDDKGTPKTTFTRERLLKRSKNYEWENPVHEYVKIHGKYFNSDICITHRKMHSSGDRNLKILENILKNEGLNDRNTFYYARELYANKKFNEAIKFYTMFLDSEGEFISYYLDACMDLAKCYYIRKEDKKALRCLLRSFEFGIPRAEICCMIGEHFKIYKEYDKAIYWYKEATKLEKPKTWASVTHDSWGYRPNMELCACYYKIGNIEEAKKYNDIAGEYKPEDKIYLHNKKFFDILQSYTSTK
ncbi:tetratricopeptide repeat-containing glycosyltransferase [Vallitalea maricola]|uniref:Glycosyltransferase family 2 protein n=1 Tax=Vallitalea maricola TaxID=3074433 RepID=A0ACB5UP51_9FIRM|nr:glycosyltransferase family 2 protein [Vallitalea sp. AN17-2]